MEKTEQEKMRLRIEFSRQNNQLFSDNIPAYADFLENKLVGQITDLNQLLNDFEELKKTKLYENSFKAIDDCIALVHFRISKIKE